MTIDPYDDFLYPNYCYPETHPDRLGSRATLFGMKPAPAELCRVLELACGDGANLMPMAYGLPNSEFLGVDRASQPIARGKEMIAALKLKNLELRQFDLLALPTGLGKFDYIIAHGLYSWVPPAVQDRILEICRSCLNPQGIAYISYNVYPGCHLRAITRGMMLYHVRELKDAHQRVAQGRALVNWVADAHSETNAYSLFLREAKDALANRNDGAIYHDDIAEVNSPLYFYQFITRAARYGLQFLSEAEYFYTEGRFSTTEVAQQLEVMGQDDILGKEQYMDFLEGRSFRQTLLCHHEVELNRSLTSDLVRQFYIRSQAQPVNEEPDLRSQAIEEFRGAKECSIATSFPLAKAAIRYLGQICPHSVPFSDLLVGAQQLLGAPACSLDSEEARLLAEVILKAYGAGVAELSLHEPTFSLKPSERPVASPLARLQAQHGSIVTSLTYNTVKFEDLFGRQLLSLLDGTRDRETLLKEFSELIEQNIQTDATTGSPVVELEKLRPTIAQKLDDKLAELGRLGFLLA